MINSISTNLLRDNVVFSILLITRIIGKISSIFTKFLSDYPPPLPSGATIATIHQDENYGEKRNQIIFNQWFAQTIDKTIILFDKPSYTVESILRFIGKERRAIARQLGHNHAELFGKVRHRIEWMYTPITRENRYSSYIDRCHELFFKQKGPCPFQGKIPGETNSIPLSCVDWRQSYIAVIHANITDEQHHKIMDYLTQKTYEIFRNDNISGKELLQILGTIHWWLAQTMFFQRGSACITEVFIQALATDCGYPSTHWKKETMPDLEAILSEHDDFVARYDEILLLT